MKLPIAMIKKKYQITVCADGFVSVVDNMKNRRLKAGLPILASDDMGTALRLISKVCELSCCAHGGKTGTTVEPKIPCWPRGGCSDGNGEKWMNYATSMFKKAEDELGYA